MMKPMITLLTDFGLKDTYIGQMKGVIGSICPEVKVVDITHEVPAQDIAYGGYLLCDAMEAFPRGTIHVVVVDPGVGSERKAIAVKFELGYLIGPDNGIFTEVINRYGAETIIELDQPDYWFGESKTFHGRDIFAPASAHLACGVMLRDMGTTLNDLVKLNLPELIVHDQILTGHIVMIDHFGNMLSNIRRDEYENWLEEYEGELLVRGEDTRLHGICKTFADVSEGAAVAYFGSSARLEIGVRNRNAAQELDGGIGDIVIIEKINQ
ncbi:SAM-dependent chlorinase/fluorinase [Planctomycetota bacterium]|nr:SAM-dependent chlorinase/fluorinase [Planctomycetota bacterium]